MSRNFLLTIRSAESNFYKLRASSVAKALFLLNTLQYERF
jgi:hypothetical protein